MIRRVAAVVGVLVVALLGSIALAGTADAAPGYGTWCPRICATVSGMPRL